MILSGTPSEPFRIDMYDGRLCNPTFQRSCVRQSRFPGREFHVRSLCFEGAATGYEAGNPVSQPVFSVSVQQCTCNTLRQEHNKKTWQIQPLFPLPV